MDTMMSVRAQDQSALSPATILVVEDEWLVRLPIAEYLRDCGYRVLEASDADEAMAMIDSGQTVDLVFSDVRMPGSIDGFGLARWLRRNHPDVPVLLASGYSGVATPDPEIRSLGRLIEKPYSQPQVARRIEALLSD